MCGTPGEGPGNCSRAGCYADGALTEVNDRASRNPIQLSAARQSGRELTNSRGNTIRRMTAPNATRAMQAEAARSRRHGSASRVGAVGGRKKGLELTMLVGLWVLVLFDIQWLIARYGPSVVLKSPTLLLLALAAVLAFGDRSLTRRWQWYAPVLCFIGIGFFQLPFTINPLLAWDHIKQQLIYWFIIAATISLVDNARRVESLFLLYGLSFIWWGLWGGRTGQVYWHTTLANYDGYGALMVIGLGFCSFLAVAVGKGRMRWIMLAAAALCVIGIVASFARGAFLASVAVFIVVWLRSPRKGLTLACGFAAAGLVAGAAAVLHPGEFVAEIQSVFAEGTTEGTGNDRWVLWMAAWEVFLHEPFFGAGPNNWGVAAAQHFSAGDLGSRYTYNVGALYTRSLHSMYFTILSEYGIAGCAAFIWILVDFWKRNAALRTKAVAQQWKAIGGRYQLRALALGLEVAMVGFLTIAGMYSTDGKHWFYTILALNLLLHSLAAPHIRTRAMRGAPGVAVKARGAGIPAGPRRAETPASR